MKVLYLDCFSGISGDMFVGALLDMGVDFRVLQKSLEELNSLDFDVSVKKVMRAGLAGSKFTVTAKSTQSCHRHLKDIVTLIEDSNFSPFVKERSKSIFNLLASAEATIHGTTPDKIHFHEVGAVDSIIDVIGTILCIEFLGVEKIICSPLPVGSGYAKCEHGTIPLPAPATLELLKGKPITSSDIFGETVTPTGAALAVGLSSEFASMPSMTVNKIGYGAGSRDNETPNLLRAVIGSTNLKTDLLTERICVLETNIDNMNPEFYDHIIKLVLANGALDVTITPVHMKKNRPANIVTVLCRHADKQLLIDILLRETPSLGVRFREEARMILDRETLPLESPFGTVSIKVGKRTSGKIINVAPEWEECFKLAQIYNMPVKIIYDKIKALAVMKYF